MAEPASATTGDVVLGEADAVCVASCANPRLALERHATDGRPRFRDCRRKAALACRMRGRCMSSEFLLYCVEDGLKMKKQAVEARRYPLREAGSRDYETLSGQFQVAPCRFKYSAAIQVLGEAEVGSYGIVWPASSRAT